MTTRKVPTEYEEEAAQAATRGDWKRAAELYDAAAGASIGARRAEWYTQRAEYCRGKLVPPRLQDESSGDCPTGCGRPAYPRAIPGVIDGYADACDTCAADVVADAAHCAKLNGGAS